VTPCNMSLDRLAKRSKDGVRAAGGFPLEFMTRWATKACGRRWSAARSSLIRWRR
jgi:dihydroxy-acid dehydratase